MGKILRAVTNDGTAKISVITAPDMVERARDIHRLLTASTMTNTMSATTQNTIVPEGGITIITSLAF